MPKASTIEVRFAGPGIRPSEIPLGALARALQAIQRLSRGDDFAAEADDGDEDADVLVDDAALRLVQVKKGSAIFQCWAPDIERSIVNIRNTGQALRKPEKGDRLAAVLVPLQQLSRIARRLKCKISLRRPAKSADLLTVDQDTYAAVARDMLVHGDTTLIGSVERVGGAEEARCAIRLATQPRLLYCAVEDTDGSLVRKLGENLYKSVAISGRATWLRVNWKVVGFSVRKVATPSRGKLAGSVNAVRRAGGDAWDRIDDPEQFLIDMTGED